MRIVWALSESERRAARSLVAAGLCALGMAACAFGWRYGLPASRVMAAVAVPGFSFGWLAYVVAFWGRIHAAPSVADDEDESLAA